MPALPLQQGDRILLKQGAIGPVRSIAKTLRPHLARLHEAGLVRIYFEWECFDTFAVVTDEGHAALHWDQERNRTTL